MVPRVSVLLPVHNGASFVGRAIASVQAQTFRDWELVVVDDGSSDGTRPLLEDAMARDPRIRMLAKPHGGLVAALETGLAQCRGALVARLDADDEAHAERFEQQVNYLEAQPEIGLVGCLVEFGGDRKENEGYSLHVDWINSLTTPGDIALNRFVESPFAHPSVMFRRELVDRHGGYRAGDFPEDYELWLRWLDAGVKMAKIPRVLLRWHDSSGRLSRTDARYAADKFYRVKAQYLARWLTASGRSQGRPIYVWGAGRPTRKRAALLEEFGVAVSGYFDVDPQKATRAIGGTGRPVRLPGEIPPPSDTFVLGYVASRGARELIRRELSLRAYREGEDFVMCA